MNINALSSTAPLSKPNKYKFNGNEEQTEFDWNVFDFNARFYDGALGRFMNIDPLGEQYYDHSPYSFVLNNPIHYVDPDGREVWVSSGDGERVRYDNGQLFNEDGSDYEGDDEFAASTLKHLNALFSQDNGAKVLENLMGSDNIFTFTNEEPAEGAGGQFIPDNKNGGGTFQMGSLSNLSEEDGLGNVAHEAFHAYQYENGQDRISSNNEIGAYLFGKAAVLNSGVMGVGGFGNNSSEGSFYQSAMNNLFYGLSFDRDNYEKAIRTFHKGSSVNNTGIYNRMPGFLYLKQFKKPLISQFYPLIK